MRNAATPYYQAVLREGFEERVRRNARYSLRAYAKTLGIEPSALSKILAGKRFFTEKLASRFFRVLDLSEQEQDKFLRSVAAAKHNGGVGRLSPRLRSLLTESRAQVERELDPELFKVIADWHHYAILELTQTASFRSDPEWIARKLGLGESECRFAIDRLISVGLLVREGKTLRKAETWIDTAGKTKTSAAHRRRQLQILQKSAASLENDPIDIRNHSAVTVPIDPDRIPEAKKMIAEFMWNLAGFLSSTRKEKVYELSVQLFPLSKD